MSYTENNTYFFFITIQLNWDLMPVHLLVWNEMELVRSLQVSFSALLFLYSFPALFYDFVPNFGSNANVSCV